jgi:hypothetical protein
MSEQIETKMDTVDDEMFDWAGCVTNHPKCDMIMLALDILGWKVVSKYPEEINRKWTLNGIWQPKRSEPHYLPDWCEPA